MLSPLRNRFGIPGVISVVALVFAMTGGAFAAKYLITSTKQISPSVLKKLKGATGPAGPAGAQGPAGPAGANGKDGASGTNGKDGTNGTSVTSSAASAEECPAGGTKFTSASGTSKVCNGQTGFTETLPSGKTETGVFAQTFPAVSGEDSNGDTFTAEVTGNQRLPISFNIPLSAAPAPTVVTEEQQANEEVPAQCDSDDDGVGSFEEPQADLGNLCGFISAENNISFGPVIAFPSKVGAVLVDVTTESAGFVQGTWAVTGE
jgi:Collagen triple helix repeat (20 copies)